MVTDGVRANAELIAYFGVTLPGYNHGEHLPLPLAHSSNVDEFPEYLGNPQRPFGNLRNDKHLAIAVGAVRSNDV